MQGSASRAASRAVKGRKRWSVIITISKDQEPDEGMWTTYSSELIFSERAGHLIDRR